MNDFFQFNNDKPTICFTRIRSSERYTKPLQSIADSMFHVCKAFMHNNPQYNYKFFHFIAPPAFSLTMSSDNASG